MKKYTLLTVICLLFLAPATMQAQLLKANKKFERMDYAMAIKYYLRHIEKVPTSVEAMEKLSHSYRLTNDTKNAEYWYGRLMKTGKADPQNFFYYSQMLITNEKWDDAVPWLEKYLEEREWDEVAQNMLESSRNYREFMVDSARYDVKPSNINTAKAEFSPTIYRNSIVFTSSRGKEKEIYGRSNDNFLDLYQAQYDGRAQLGEPVALPGSANSKYHEGGPTFNADGNVMYFTRNDFVEGKLNKSKGGIVRLKTYQADLVNNRWENVRPVTFNGEDFSVGHPSLSPDGSRLYFVSDKSGGEGGTDIWYVEQQGKGWSEPKNMGPRVNTSGDEMFPWVSPTGVFFFASAGHPGLGGMDIFRVTSMGSEFEKVSNMGYPVNSPRDDFAMVIDEKTGIGFFSSNRLGGKGDDDIYTFEQRQILEGVVVDAKTGLGLENMKVEVYGVKGILTTLRTNNEGRFRHGLDRNTDYKLIATGDNYLEAAQIVSTVSFDPSVPVEALLKMAKDPGRGPQYTLNGKVEGDSADLAGATVRIIAKEVVVTVDENGNFQYSLAPETDYEVRVQKEGFMDKVMDVTTKGKDPGDISLEAMLYRLMPDTAMYRIFYDYDDSYIRTDAYKELDHVIDYMKRNPTIKLRLVSHADARGSKYYNDRLSKKRSMNAYQYLRKHGIAKERLEYVWVGERKPVNDCVDGVDCPEDDHQPNRRTVIEYAGEIEPKAQELILNDEEEPAIDDEAEEVPTSKNDIKGMDVKSGKDAIKDSQPKTGKDVIKDAVKEDSSSNGRMIQDMDTPTEEEAGAGEMTDGAAGEMKEAAKEMEEAGEEMGGTEGEMMEEAAEEMEGAAEEVVEEAEKVDPAAEEKKDETKKEEKKDEDHKAQPVEKKVDEVRFDPRK